MYGSNIRGEFLSLCSKKLAMAACLPVGEHQKWVGVLEAACVLLCVEQGACVYTASHVSTSNSRGTSSGKGSLPLNPLSLCGTVLPSQGSILSLPLPPPHTSSCDSWANPQPSSSPSVLVVLFPISFSGPHLLWVKNIGWGLPASWVSSKELGGCDSK